MDYQPNQQPGMPNQQPGMYDQQFIPNQSMMPNQQIMMVNMEEMRRHRKSTFEAMCDKIAEFFNTNKVLRTLSGFSDILSYLITVVCLTLTILNMAINSSGSATLMMSTNSIALGLVTIFFAFLALSKRKILPLALALSAMTVLSIISTIMSIVYVAKFADYINTQNIVMYVFNLIFAIFEIGFTATFAVISWQSLVNSPAPKQYQHPIYGQPPQQYQQPMTPQASVQQYQQPAASQTPVQQYQQPAASQAPAQPIQPMAPVQPETPANDWTCTCGTVNPSNAHFCFNCGKPKNS